ncbi:hypothetical protein NUU61_007500 [Penicillium alfredii]|uniref:Roadblock/LAMTOR2 domain-containing protein n=1 Tax=Penicillium alfredii TaxID=1506179 RepID=A0A9W9F2X0_9EURO|nr:uncharacterized protein NUU61_007500 [Penicillium alfredii]KAJ5092630.1 hypothetical protein NUU61_007500 [Penicillium alfredii]
MANPTTWAQQVPHHVTALLSHLTSRPGVQSTLILSRKDGSIIQSTGLLAPPSAEEARSSRAAQASPSTVSDPNPLASASSSDSSPASPTPATPTPSYQPSQAEALAAHISAFVSSASALGLSLSRPAVQSTGDGQDPSAGWDAGHESYGNGTITPREEDRDADVDCDEDDEVKLLRMRTRKHEIVIVPDRKYLLCVVHDATPSSAGPGAAATRSSR